MDLRAVKAKLIETGRLVEEYLPSCLETENAPERLRTSMRYSLLAGGKRVRPVLCLTAAALFGARMEDVLPFACGIEMIHTYSLIHDDLPAMDDDDLRRGRPSNHKAFDEATAILAGDALQADAFCRMTLCPLPAELVLKSVRTFAEAAGSGGMCGGQELDMQATGTSISLPELKHLHALKTGAILCASAVTGGILAGASGKDLEALTAYGRALGVAFQIADDILDVVSDTETLGKPAGSDAEMDKNTYPSLAGLEKSRELAHAYAAQAEKALAPYAGEHAEFLRGLALYTVERVN